MIKDSFPQNSSFHEKNPFASPKFYSLLEKTGCTNENTGWTPLHFEANGAILPGYIKDHSYGEYIFDWSWANFYEQINEPYYPKLTHMVPFSPVNSPKFLNATDCEKRELAHESFNFYQGSKLTGEHYLFTNEEEFQVLTALGFSHLKSLQYHFNNKYESFDEFLSHLKPNRKKMIKKERRKIKETDLKITKIEKDNITDQLLEDFFLFYSSTINKKQSYPYLNKAFFKSLSHEFHDKIVIQSASLYNKTIAMALFFKGNDTLFGRYWGIHPAHEKEFPGLHFELCYYRGIDYCIENKIPLFEAGAQGEHKLWRGFEPTQINSFHHLKSSELFSIIKNDIARQNQLNDQYLEKLKTLLPYRK